MEGRPQLPGVIWSTMPILYSLINLCAGEVLFGKYYINKQQLPLFFGPTFGYNWKTLSILRHNSTHFAASDSPAESLIGLT